MDIAANKILVRRYVEMWETGNIDLANEILAPTFVDHTHPGRVPGPESVKQEILAFHAGFSDIRVTIAQLIGEGDTLAFRFVLRGTHRGNFASFAPTGKEVVLTGMDFLRVADTRIVELWSSQDTLSWVLQLGAAISFLNEGRGPT